MTIILLYVYARLGSGTHFTDLPEPPLAGEQRSAFLLAHKNRGHHKNLAGKLVPVLEQRQGKILAALGRGMRLLMAPPPDRRLLPMFIAMFTLEACCMAAVVFESQRSGGFIAEGAKALSLWLLPPALLALAAATLANPQGKERKHP